MELAEREREAGQQTGFDDSNVIESLHQLGIDPLHITVEFLKIETDIGNAGNVAAMSHCLQDALIFSAVDRFSFDNIAGSEEHHEVAQVADRLIGIENGQRRNAEHLVAARPPRTE